MTTLKTSEDATQLFTLTFCSERTQANPYSTCYFYISIKQADAVLTQNFPTIKT